MHTTYVYGHLIHDSRLSRTKVKPMIWSRLYEKADTTAIIQDVGGKVDRRKAHEAALGNLYGFRMLVLVLQQ